MSMRFGLISCVIPALFVWAAFAAPAVAGGDAWAGSYRADEGLGLELRPAGNGYYEGAILLGQERLALRRIRCTGRHDVLAVVVDDRSQGCHSPVPQGQMLAR